MRRLTDRDRLERFMISLGREARTAARIYFTGGASAVLLDWRPATIDIDLDIHPDSDEILRALPRLKEELEVNIELASPAHFIPELPGWPERSPFIRHEGRVSFHHYDFYAQALAKIERGHGRDELDVREMHSRRLIDPDSVLRMFDAIEVELFRYPAIDPPSFRAAVERTVAEMRDQR